MTFALLAPPVGLRPPYATSRAKPAPPINGSHYRKGGPCSAPIGGPVWTPIDTPAPFHVVPRGWAGPGFLAMLLFEKFGQHQPLNRQAERFAREGVPLSLSTLADQVGAASAALMPLYRRIEAHVLAAERLHGDDTTVPVLAKGKTDTGRLWVYVRDDAPFGGPAPPAALFHYSRDRRGEHPRAHLVSWAGILQGVTRDAVLEFEVEIDGLHVNGVDMIRWNDDGRIVDFKVLVRPLKALLGIQQKMAALLG